MYESGIVKENEEMYEYKYIINIRKMIFIALRAMYKVLKMEIRY